MVHTIAVRSEDDTFLYQVYASTRQEEVAAWGWPPDQQESFLRMQFQMQQRSYAFQYADADHRLILSGDRPVGRILVVRTDEELLLADIALLPDFRNAGTGSALIRELQAEAAHSGKPLRLRVMKGNPARRLYERLGFAVTGESATHHAMEWRHHPAR